MFGIIDFLRKNGSILDQSEYLSWSVFWPNHIKKCFYVHEKLQRNPSIGSGLKNFIFRPYGIDYLGFLTNATQCARTDLNKRFLPKPMTTTG